MKNNKVITKVLKVSDNTKEKMIAYYKYSKRPKTPPYAIFQAEEADTVVTLYESGKVVFQGISADIDANMWNEMEMHLNNKSGLIEKKEKKEKKNEKKISLRINSIGSDEVGTGDYFGPIVVTASYVKKEDIDFLLELGVKDSKKMTDNDIIKVVPQIIKRIPYKTYVFSNKEYNNLHNESMNMNKIKAILHNKVLYQLTKENYYYDNIVVDQFEWPKAYFSHIKGAKEKVTNITFLTKAEDQCLSVACASLISRYIFLKERKNLEEKYYTTLPLGSGPKVDEKGRELVKKYGENILKEIAKYSFANTKKILTK